MNPNQETLFPDPDKTKYGENRHHQNLFLPRLLEQESVEKRLRGEAWDRAFQIMSRWADLEMRGKLKTRKESNLEAEFLTEVFGEALGYKLFSKGDENWDIEVKYNVNGGEADAAIGNFGHQEKASPVAVIEFKGPNINLDRDRSRGRTAVQQCWDYMNAIPQCPWGIVCNFVSFRLYHREHTPRTYQLFTLQDLHREEIFRQFYYVLERGGLLPGTTAQKPRALVLLEKTGARQQEVGDELYDSYHRNRVKLIKHLTGPQHKKSQDEAIRIAQKLLDRIIFVAFCEDRNLLPQNSIHKAYSQSAPFDQVTHPKWKNFLDLFRSVDQGNKRLRIPPFDGGLFREDPEVDNLKLDDEWTDFFEIVGKYDFRDEVNVEVLGHLFEKSINDLERIKLTGLFDAVTTDDEQPRMTKSAERKRHGVYYTPSEFTEFITHNTVGKIIDDRIQALARNRGVQIDAQSDEGQSKETADFWRECLSLVRTIKVVDPACGSGAFLISAYSIFEEKYHFIIDQIVYHAGKDDSQLADQVPEFILNDNLFGVDLSQEAVEISQLALWIRSAQPDKSLADLSRNVVHGNSLVDDPEVDARALNWREIFTDVFERDENGFDCVIGNPPWERIKLQEREFFDASDPKIASAVNAATRRQMVDDLKTSNPELYERYIQAKENAEGALKYIRESDRYPLTGKGDVNTYSVFAELARTIVAPNGLVGLLVPSGIATDNTTKEFFNALVSSESLSGLYDFENRKKVFPDVDSRYKFCVLLFGGSKQKAKSMDFVFFAHRVDELEDKSRHIKLSPADIKLLNPNTRTCPIFRSQRDAELTKSIYRRVPILIDRNREEGGNPWGIKFHTMFHQTNDAELFINAEKLKEKKFRRVGNRWIKGKSTYLPLYEAKMVQMYDHRAASIRIDPSNWMRQGQTIPASLVEHQNPEFVPEPRWWVNSAEIPPSVSRTMQRGILSYKDITSPTNRRTMIAAQLPLSAVMNSAPLIETDAAISARRQSCLLANLNTVVLDFVARQKVGGVHLNFFIVEQLPILSPDRYSDRCPWDRRQTLEKWISDRVLKLSCTSNDMIPLAEAAGFDPPVHKWKPDERKNLLAELDAAYFILYGIEKDDAEYILTTFAGARTDDSGLFDLDDAISLTLKHYDLLLGKASQK